LLYFSFVIFWRKNIGTKGGALNVDEFDSRVKNLWIIADVRHDVTSMMTCRNICFLSSSGDDLGDKKREKSVSD